MKKYYVLGAAALVAATASATLWQGGALTSGSDTAGVVVAPAPLQPAPGMTGRLAGGSEAVTAQAAGSKNYQLIAKNFLNKVHNNFIKTGSTPNASVPMYANVLNYNSGSDSYGQGSDVAYLWTHENMIRALYWGARVDETQFKPLMIASIDQLDWYWNPNCAGSAPGAPPGGYGVRHGQPCYYDDNALLGGVMMNVYLDTYLDPSAANAAFNALLYVDNNQNSHNGVGQKPGAADWSTSFYMSPVTRVGASYARWAARFPNKSQAPARLAWANDMFDQVNLASMDLKAPSGLFRGGAQCTSTSQPFVCSAGNSGVLAGNSTGVANLALAIHRSNPSETAKLNYARNLMNLVLNHSAWFPTSGGIKQNAPTGGYATIDLLCQLYLIDGDEIWHDAAQTLVDFLIDHNRDRYGWYANGVPGDGDQGGEDDDPNGLAGTWAEDRSGSSYAADAKVRLLTQSAAAAALMEFAYIRQVRNGS